MIKITSKRKQNPRPFAYNMSISKGRVDGHIVYCDNDCILSTPFGSINISKGIYKARILGTDMPEFMLRYIKYKKREFTPTKEFILNPNNTYPQPPVDNLLKPVDNTKSCG